MKRYAATFDCYIYAENDEDAREQAQKISQLIRSHDDNMGRCFGLGEIPFGLITGRKIDL